MLKNLANLLIILLIFTTSVIFSSLQAKINLPLMPWPTQIKLLSKEHPLILTPNLIFDTNDSTLKENIKLWKERIYQQTGWNTGTILQLPATKFTLRIQKQGYRLPMPDMVEKYQLTINSKGISLYAETRWGAIRGMETVLQLIRNNQTKVTLPQVTITDSPRFSWRGVLIDPARRFIPISDIKRLLDGMAAAKLNVLHWHLTDDQGWRFESKEYPKLQQLASDQQYYSQQEMRDIVKYAATRGIRVIPEIELPGHTSALAVAYPEFMSAPGPYKMQRQWGTHKTTIDPSREITYTFIDILISELANIFPDPYIHIGSHSIDESYWSRSESVQSFMEQNNIANNIELYDYFNRRIETIMKKYNRKMVIWKNNSIVTTNRLDKNTIIEFGTDTTSPIILSKNSKILYSTPFDLSKAQPPSYYYNNSFTTLNSTNSPDISFYKSDNNWQFQIQLPEQKTLEGYITFISSGDGSIKFTNQIRQPIKLSRQINNTISFTADTSIGAASIQIQPQKDTLNGFATIGNVRYPLKGEKSYILPTQNDQQLNFNQKYYDQIIGGEILIWGESIDSNNLDIKVWPTIFAIAERFWSPKTVDNTEDMYKRLSAIDAWSIISVGLKQNTLFEKQLLRLTQHNDIKQLVSLTQALEPAHYLSRIAKLREISNYDQLTPLNRLIDILPSENNKSRQLKTNISLLLDDRKNRPIFNEVKFLLQNWVNNAEQLLISPDSLYLPDDIRSIAQDVAKLAKLGLVLLEIYSQNKPLSFNEHQHAKRLIEQMILSQNEIVIPMVYSLEKLLDAILVSTI